MSQKRSNISPFWVKTAYSQLELSHYYPIACNVEQMGGHALQEKSAQAHVIAVYVSAILRVWMKVLSASLPQISLSKIFNSAVIPF